MKNLKIILLLMVLFNWNHFYGQGCSDAGFCTISTFKPNSADSINEFKNQVKFGAFYGNADNSITVYGNYVEYNRQLNNRFVLNTKLTTLAQNGNGISTFGLSDLYVNANYKINEKAKVTFGAKIPLNNSTNNEGDLPLPMDYQSSLGTFDLLLGFGYEIKKFQFVAALQQPLTQNDNEFSASDFPLQSEISSFQSTRGFIRSGDVLIRVSYPFDLTSKLKLTPSILPIYHLANDKYKDELNIEREIKGSQGITLNGNVYLDYKINSKSDIQLNLGMPFIVRDTRPDGLTRSFIANLEYSFKF